MEENKSLLVEPESKISKVKNGQNVKGVEYSTCSVIEGGLNAYTGLI
jgi:hypothetical protein